MILPEYGIKDLEHPTSGEIHSYAQGDEAKIIRAFVKAVKVDWNLKLCIDITGFLRPHLVFFVRVLYELGARSVDFIYSDPLIYIDKEKTKFSSVSKGVSQIAGYKGTTSIDTNDDILIIGAGYDYQRIYDVAKEKSLAEKVLLFGFPSLQPDMFQENVIRAYEANDDTSAGQDFFLDPDYTLFAPANDPFVTAQVISDFVKSRRRQSAITNLYLSPISTKAQTLGMSIFYIWECLTEDVSMIFPYCESYHPKTTEGIAKIWKYSVEFPRI